MPVTDYVKPEGLYRPRGFVHVAVATGSKVLEIGWDSRRISATFNSSHLRSEPLSLSAPIP